jgi:glycosyltransferase involved in cell wall biosynthesis
MQRAQLRASRRLWLKSCFFAMIETPVTQAPPEQHDAATHTARAVAITVVIPVQNQRNLIAARYAEVCATLSGMAYEIIVVDDGSSDGSFAVLRQLAANDPLLRVVRLRRAFGRTAALAAGFARARGGAIITLDADGQTDPADIPHLIDQLDRGFDVVSGWRRDLRQPLDVAAANWLISATTGVQLHDYGCPLKAYRADVVKEMNLYGDLYRFIPAIASWQGVQVAEIDVRSGTGTHEPARPGFLRAIRVLLDLITVRFLLGYAARPMQSFGLIGGGLLAVSVLLGGYLAFVKIGLGEDIGDRPLLLLTALLALVGIQFLVLGLLAELTTRVYYEIQGKPIYVVRETIEGSETSET